MITSINKFRTQYKPVNEAITFSYDKLPVVGDVVTKVTYGNEDASFDFASGNSICGFTSDKVRKIESMDMLNEYERVKGLIPDRFKIDGMGARVLDLQFVMEEGRDPRFVACVDIKTGEIFKGASGVEIPRSNYVDYEIDDLMTAIDSHGNGMNESSDNGKDYELVHYSYKGVLSMVKKHGLVPSSDGCLGPGTYFWKSHPLTDPSNPADIDSDTTAFRIKPNSVKKYFELEDLDELPTGGDTEVVHNGTIKAVDLDYIKNGKWTSVI